MSLTYIPRKKSGLDFDCNSAGADLLGALHGACGAALHKSILRGRENHDFNWIAPRVPYDATANEARRMAYMLNAAGESIWMLVLKDTDWGCYWGGSELEWIEHVKSWIQFLETSNGYRAL